MNKHKTIPTTFRPHFRRTPLQACIAMLMGLTSASVLGNPVGGQVVAGSATIGGGAGLLQVNQSSNRAIINWQNFSINSGETTRFVLPSASAAVLNRVVTNGPSALYGNLTSNGQVFLINPSGVVVGPSGVINTANLVISSRNVSDSAFMNGGPLAFSGSGEGKIVNLGSITASSGDAVLAGSRVENGGSISARNGTVALVAGNQVLYAPNADSRVTILSGVDATATQSGVDNSGVIEAAQAELRSAGGDPYALAVNHSGVITATKVNSVGGKVILSGDGSTQVSGSIAARADDASNAIQVLGDKVTLTGTASLDSSGAAGGGTVLVGGDYQGRNAAIRNAGTTTVQAGAQIRADATQRGNGGKVVVWADGTTNYAGAISATGGLAGGNGGIAEVSGKSGLGFHGRVDLRARNAVGTTGNLLLDPTDITIGSAQQSSASCQTGTCMNGGNSSYLNVEDLQNALATAAVTVSTASSGGAFGDITIDQTVNALPTVFSISAAYGLTLKADRDILLQGPLNLTSYVANSVATPPTPLTLEAGRSITVAPGLQNGGYLPALYADGDVTLAAGLKYSTGTITIGPGSDIQTGANYNVTPLYPYSIRIFALAPQQADLTGWTGSFSAPVTTGVAYGNPSATAEGIYFAYANASQIPAMMPPPTTTTPPPNSLTPTPPTSQQTPVQSAVSNLVGDVGQTDAALKAKIDALVREGVFTGMPSSNGDSGMFGNLTRQDFAIVLSKILGIGTTSSNPGASSFSDVSDGGDWTKGYIEAAKKAGLLSSANDGVFKSNGGSSVPGGPPQEITKEMTAALLQQIGKSPDQQNAFGKMIAQAMKSPQFLARYGKLLSGNTSSPQQGGPTPDAQPLPPDLAQLLNGLGGQGSYTSKPKAPSDAQPPAGDPKKALSGPGGSPIGSMPPSFGDPDLRAILIKQAYENSQQATIDRLATQQLLSQPANPAAGSNPQAGPSGDVQLFARDLIQRSLGTLNLMGMPQ